MEKWEFQPRGRHGAPGKIPSLNPGSSVGSGGIFGGKSREKGNGEREEDPTLGNDSSAPPENSQTQPDFSPSSQTPGEERVTWLDFPYKTAFPWLCRIAGKFCWMRIPVIMGWVITAAAPALGGLGKGGGEIPLFLFFPDFWSLSGSQS